MNFKHLPLLLASVAVIVFSCKKEDECVPQTSSARIQGLWGQVIVDNSTRPDFNTYFTEFDGASENVYLQSGNCADTLCNSVQLELKDDFTYTLTYSLLPANAATPVTGVQSGTYSFVSLCYDEDLPGLGGVGATAGEINFLPAGNDPYTVEFYKEDVKPWQLDGVQVAQGTLTLTVDR